MAQTRRTETYRLISSGASDKIHVLAFDYRGFGRSTGTPTEDGLVIDAIDVISWAIEVAGIPSQRIVLLAQSLGTGLVAAAASHFVNIEPRYEFAGIVLCAPFLDFANVLLSYKVFQILPLFTPFRMSKYTRSWFSNQMTDTWKTCDRIADMTKKSDRLRLTLVHALNDPVIPWRYADTLFYIAANATVEGGLSSQAFEEQQQIIQLGEGGWTKSWVSDQKHINLVIVRYGSKLPSQSVLQHCLNRLIEHNTIMKWAPVALVIAKAFEYS